MNQYSTESEYILAESEKTHPMEKPLANLGQDFTQVEVALEQLHRELGLVQDTLEKIRDSLLDLEQSVQEPQ